MFFYEYQLYIRSTIQTNYSALKMLVIHGSTLMFLHAGWRYLLLTHLYFAVDGYCMSLILANIYSDYSVYLLNIHFKIFPQNFRFFSILFIF